MSCGTSYHLSCLTVAFSCDRTAVDYVNSAFFGKFADCKAVTFELLGDRRAFVLINFTAKRHNSYLAADICSYFNTPRYKDTQEFKMS